MIASVSYLSLLAMTQGINYFITKTATKWAKYKILIWVASL